MTVFPVSALKTIICMVGRHVFFFVFFLFFFPIVYTYTGFLTIPLILSTFDYILSHFTVPIELFYLQIRPSIHKSIISPIGVKIYINCNILIANLSIIYLLAMCMTVLDCVPLYMVLHYYKLSREMKKLSYACAV